LITPPDFGERWTNRLRAGEAAPEFSLPLLKPTDAKAEPNTVSLAELHAKKPAVLIFGSITCPPFRGQLSGIDKVYRDFRDQAEFLFVYIREAHPDSVLSVADTDGQASLVKILQPADDATRQGNAEYCQRTAKLEMPVAVDGVDNAVGKAYAGWPNRMVVVGTDGKLLYAGDPGAGATNAERLRMWLQANLPQAKN
jgi:hypothetical protein